MKSLYLYIFLVFSFFCSHVSAQNYTMYNLDRMAQANYENPAYAPNSRIYLGIGISNQYIGVENSGFAIDDVLKPRQDDSLEIDLPGLKAALNDLNIIGFDTRNELFGLGINIRKSYWSFTVSNRLSTSFIYPKDLLVLLIEGNGNSLLGERADLDGLGINANGYIEYSLGFNKLFGEKLRLGAHLKLLSGYANINTKTNLGLTTDANTFKLILDGKVQLNSSGFEGALDTSDATSMNLDYQRLYSFQNMGVALDLGATFNLTERIQLNASLLDLGFIRWKEDLANYHTDDFHFEFSGVDANQYLNDTTNSLGSFGDSLVNYFNNEFTHESYKTALNTRFYLGVSYSPIKWLSLGATSYNRIVAGHFNPGLILSATTEIGKWLGATVNYALYKNNYTNLGVGLSFRLGPVQAFVMTNNILAINYTSVRSANVSFGVNFMLGKNKHSD